MSVMHTKRRQYNPTTVMHLRLLGRQGCPFVQTGRGRGTCGRFASSRIHWVFGRKTPAGPEKTSNLRSKKIQKVTKKKNFDSVFLSRRPKTRGPCCCGCCTFSSTETCSSLRRHENFPFSTSEDDPPRGRQLPLCTFIIIFNFYL